MLNLSQQEYVNRIDELNNQLISAWDQDQRVKALKIAIQVGADEGAVQSFFIYIEPQSIPAPGTVPVT